MTSQRSSGSSLTSSEKGRASSSRSIAAAIHRSTARGEQSRSAEHANTCISEPVGPAVSAISSAAKISADRPPPRRAPPCPRVSRLTAKRRRHHDDACRREGLERVQIVRGLVPRELVRKQHRRASRPVTRIGGHMGAQETGRGSNLGQHASARRRDGALGVRWLDADRGRESCPRLGERRRRERLFHPGGRSHLVSHPPPETLGVARIAHQIEVRLRGYDLTHGVALFALEKFTQERQ